MLLRKTYGIDLGSSSIKVYSFFKNKSYIEKNMIASRERKIIAVGNEAYEMFEKAPADILVNAPMSFGMIANLELQEIALYSMMKKIDKFLGVGSDMFFSIPLDMTAIEKRAYYYVANGHWLRKNRGRGTGSGCTCHGSKSSEKYGQYDRKYRRTEYAVFDYFRWKDHHSQKDPCRRQADE